MDQIGLFPRDETPPKNRCEVCQHYSALVEPREIGGDARIYGYCFKDGTKVYSPNMGMGWPIYLPIDCGTACKSFRRRAEA